MNRIFSTLRTPASVLAVSLTLAPPVLAAGSNPIEDLAATLDVKIVELMMCMGDDPQEAAVEPTDAQRAEFVHCLQAFNAELTVDRVDAGMEALRNARS